MLFSAIEKTITDAISMFILEINEQYPEIHVDHLEEMWNKVKGNDQNTKETKKKNIKEQKRVKATKRTKEQKKDDQQDEIKELEQENEEDEIKDKKKMNEDNEETVVCTNCIYVFTKGDKKSQICGIKTKDSSYCTKHKKHQVVEKVDKKPLKTEEKVREKCVNIVLVKHKTLEKLYHPESNLVFKSNKERIVIGKCVDNNLIPLKNEDIEECKRWRFNYEEQEENLEHTMSEEELFDKMIAEE